MLTNRWMLITALVVSVAMWLVLSSVTANAAHILAKGDFSWRGYGSVSAWLVAAGLLWTVAICYVATAHGGLNTKGLFLACVGVATWVVLLLFLTAVIDPWLGQIKAAALLIWVIELIGVAVVLVVIARYWPQSAALQSWLPASAFALALAAGVKALLFCVLPGAAIRL